jgi:hypothetical protein
MAVRRTRKYRVSPAEYRAFIDGLELEWVYLKSSTGKRMRRANLEAVLTYVERRGKASYEVTEDGFRASLPFSYRFLEKDAEEPFGAISCEYVAEYRSSVVLTDDLFQVFRDMNLPTNLWPYVREHIHTTMLKMGLPPLVLKTMKT